MKKKVLITGLGSVGQRHARNLNALYGNSIELYAYRQRNLNHVIHKDLTMTEGAPEKEYRIIRTFSNLEMALSTGIDAVFITNPPQLHIDTAIAAVKAGAHVFIEKPLSHNLEKIDQLIELLNENNKVGMVGHQFRYHIITKKIKQIIKNDELGKLCSAQFIFAEYFPGMHPYEDYRISHAAREEKGGGAILSLNHDIDIACYFFGLPRKIFCIGGKYSSLEMNTEDTAQIIMEASSEFNKIPIHILLDFISRPTRREWIISGDKGTVKADLVKSTLTIEIHNHDLNSKPIIEDYSSFVRDEMFYGEIRDFFSAIDHSSKSPIEVSEAKNILQVALAAKQSIKTGHVINNF